MDEKYVTIRNVMLAVVFIVIAILIFLLGWCLGAYWNQGEIKDFETTTSETTTVTATTEKTTSSETSTTTMTTEETTSDISTTTTNTTTKPVTTTKPATTKPAETTAKAVKTGEELTFLGTFKGTYYAGKSIPCKGGSGRTLIDCTVGSDWVKGSVASKYAYQKWGYKANGGRTKLYLVVTGRPSMTGWYWVDDCNADSKIIDFYYYKNSNCPFQKAGVVEVKAYA